METSVQMTRGQEIWLEKSRISGNVVDLAILYGHDMHTDGVPEMEKITPFVYSPDGETLIPSVTLKQDRYILNFRMTKKGHYIVIVDFSPVIFSQARENKGKGLGYPSYDVMYSGSFHQTAKIIVSTDDAGDYREKPIHGALEIVPKTSRMKMGSEIELSVFYDGEKLALAEIKAISKKDGRKAMVVKTDENGIARIPITCEGEWLFLARHRDRRRCIEGKYDESVFIHTLVMETAK